MRKSLRQHEERMQRVQEAALRSYFDVRELSDACIEWMHHQTETRKKRLEKLESLGAPQMIINNERRMMRACLFRALESEEHLAELMRTHQDIDLVGLLQWLTKRQAKYAPPKQSEVDPTLESVNWFKTQIASLAIQMTVKTEMGEDPVLEHLRTRDHRAISNEIYKRIIEILKRDPSLRKLLQPEESQESE